MAYVREKMKKGNPYYYIVEGRRIGNKVQQVILEYIGPFEKLKQLALTGYLSKGADNSGSDSPYAPASEADDSAAYANASFKTYAHGAVMSLLWTAEQLEIEKIMDQTFSPRIVKGLPRSRIMLLAMIQRAINPGSKREFANWCSETSLPYSLQFEADHLDSAAFWEAMDGISEKEITTAWNRLIRKLIELTGVDIKEFHLDYSNYFTFINTTNGRCVICKRGHNKQKRDDLLQFALAALTSSALNVPLIWQLYDGNTNDKTEFPAFTAHIRTQLTSLGIDPSEVTICFDGGSNSEENFSNLGFHFVCAHSLTGLKELYEIDLSQYTEVTLKNGRKRQAYFLPTLTFSGVHGAGVLVFSEALRDGQIAQLNRDVTSIQEAIADVQTRLSNKRSSLYTQLKKRKEEVRHAQRDAEDYNMKLDQEEEARQKAGIAKRGKAKKHKPIPDWDPDQEMLKIVQNAIFCKHKYCAEFIEVSLKCGEDETYVLEWALDAVAQSAYTNKYYGKKLIVTDHTDWTMEDILNEYTDQECIENGIFRTSEDVDHFAIRPQYHWTDQKIRVHVFLCLAAITIAEAMRVHFKSHGIVLPKAALLDRLNGIREGWVFNGEKKVKRALERLDQKQQELWNVAETIKEGLHLQIKTEDFE